MRYDSLDWPLFRTCRCETATGVATAYQYRMLHLHRYGAVRELFMEDVCIQSESAWYRLWYAAFHTLLISFAQCSKDSGSSF